MPDGLCGQVLKASVHAPLRPGALPLVETLFGTSRDDSLHASICSCAQASVQMDGWLDVARKLASTFIWQLPA